MNNNELMPYLIERGYEWIRDQRNLYVGTAQGLSEQDRASLQPYFEPKILDLAKIEFVDSINNPPFYPEISKLGITNLIDFTDMAGITFIDCILISRCIDYDQESWISLLFHEMVHIVQYDLLGAQQFTELYVTGWAQNGFDYGSIPLERQAYDLQRQFDQREDVFSVVQVLKKDFGRVS